MKERPPWDPFQSDSDPGLWTDILTLDEWLLETAGDTTAWSVVQIGALVLRT